MIIYNLSAKYKVNCMTNRKLIRSTGTIGFAISASRVLGFLRDILFARWFGTNKFAQAFVVAYRLPNMLRDMVGEGATDAALVPVLSEYHHTKSREEYWAAARVIFNVLILILSVLTVLGVLLAPVIIRIIAPGFLEDPETFSMAVDLTRILFPYIFFLGLVAYSKGVLNSFHYFLAPALSTVVLNICMILSLIFLRPFLGIRGVAFGVLIGGFLQVLMQIRPMYKRGFSLRGEFRLTHPVAKRIGKLLIPRAIGTTVYQLSLLVDTVLASLAWIVGAGGVAALYYSNRLIQLPLAVFGISLATAALPKMSREVALNDMEQFKRTISFSLQTVFSIMVPSAIGLMLLSRPIIQVLFQRGEFTAYSTSITVNALFFYAIGLLAYAGIKILVSAFYSMGDTRTPVRTAARALIVNVVLNLILMWPLKIGGLALATSIAATTNMVVLYVILDKRVGGIGTREILKALGRTLSASLVMGIVTFAGMAVLLGGGDAEKFLVAMKLVGLIMLSAVVYIAAAYAIGDKGIRKFTKEVYLRLKARG